MEENNVEEKKTYTKEEVEGIINQINSNASAQCKNLLNRCQFLEQQLMFKRLDYLFKVIENEHNFSIEFVQKCASEIEESITIPASQDNTEPESKED